MRKALRAASRSPSRRQQASGVRIAQEKLQGGKAEVKAIEGLNADREEEKGEARRATLTRDEAIDVLSEWLEDFLDIAEVALSDRPQLLEALGVVVRYKSCCCVGYKLLLRGVRAALRMQYRFFPCGDVKRAIAFGDYENAIASHKEYNLFPVARI